MAKIFRYIGWVLLAVATVLAAYLYFPFLADPVQQV